MNLLLKFLFNLKSENVVQKIVLNMNKAAGMVKFLQNFWKELIHYISHYIIYLLANPLYRIIDLLVKLCFEKNIKLLAKTTI